MTKNTTKVLVAGFVLGIFWFAAMRFVLVQKSELHHHANFALYVNGVRDEFGSFTNYEEIQACGGDEVNNPKTRVHMHDRVNHVVHVHDNAATWGAFFANLSYSLGNSVLSTPVAAYVDGQNGNSLQFVLNGVAVDTVANRTITSEDVLLISYGQSDDATLQQQYSTIQKDAAQYNERDDPSACSGGKPFTIGERFKKAFSFTE
jgi:hypothetical protein